MPEIQGSIEDVAKAKCLEAFKILKRPVLTEDTGLVFNAFGSDLPGPYIKWFLDAMKPAGIATL